MTQQLHALYRDPGPRPTCRDPKDTRALIAQQGFYRVWRASQNLSGPEVASIGLHVKTDPPAGRRLCFFPFSHHMSEVGYWLLAAHRSCGMFKFLLLRALLKLSELCNMTGPMP